MSYSERSGQIWFNGELVDWKDANCHVLTHGLHYGTGIFEGIRAYQTKVGTQFFRLDCHLKRFFDSAHIIQMDLPFSKAQLTEACHEVVRLNQFPEAYIRPIAFYGSEGMGLQIHPDHTVHVVVAAWEWGAYLGADGLKNGIRIKTSSYTRHNINTAMCKAKLTGQYFNSVLAHKEAVDCGYDEALFLDKDGYVTEGSGENLFLVKNGELYTPMATSCLPGLTRDTVMKLCESRNLSVREKMITRDEVYLADEAFFTGTAAEITPISSLDGRTIGEGKPGPITSAIQSDYFALVRGESEAYNNWLALV